LPSFTFFWDKMHPSHVEEKHAANKASRGQEQKSPDNSCSYSSDSPLLTSLSASQPENH